MFRGASKGAILIQTQSEFRQALKTANPGKGWGDNDNGALIFKRTKKQASSPRTAASIGDPYAAHPASSSAYHLHQSAASHTF